MFKLTTLAIGLIFLLPACAQEDTNMDTNQEQKIDLSSYSKATFGAGCFWCVEAVFQDLYGVAHVEAGYSGGDIKNPAYREVTTGRTGHAEVARIYYDPSVISFDLLLEVFWHTHNPTTLNRQGADVGTQYRSAIFYHDEAQKETAIKSKEATDQSSLWDDPIITEITPLANYYEAENYHQNYFDNNPSNPYCSAVIVPKVKKFRKEFGHLLKSGSTVK